jgi:multidrug efflux pump subunit AcrA (membrane-fusion protein)
VNAVVEDPGGASVRVKKPTGEIASVPVQIGITTLEGVEIRSGLQPGDQIVVVGGVPNS